MNTTKIRPLLLIVLTSFMLHFTGSLALAGPATFTGTSHPVAFGSAMLAETPSLEGIFDNRSAPLIRQPKPWYDSIIENRFLRLMCFGAIIVGVGAMFKNSNKGSGK
jgi:hypothetical protein